MKNQTLYAGLIFVVAGLMPNAGRANPVGEKVVAGKAVFDRSAPATLTIQQSSDRAIINWQDFSIGSGELTRFVQPGVNSATLNRVLSGNPSAIYGSLQANGRIFLINPAGLLVGSGGQINTAGFLASTLDVSSGSFMRGADLTLAGDSAASIKNQGSINAGGNVFLIARTVDNAGQIKAGKGVGLLAGSEVVLGEASGKLAVLYGKPADAAKQSDGTVSISNSGLIQAATADLRAAGGNVYALAINNSGVIRATTAANEGGHIVLRAEGGSVASSGVLDASGAGKGGEVEVLGRYVALNNTAVVDVSGAQGGTALIGGDLHGANAAVLNAQRTFVGKDAVINAGNGKVVVWADEATIYYGTVNAAGGATEVSGKNSLAFNGKVDAGVSGSVLLDPRNLTIVSSGAANDANVSSSSVNLAFATGAGTDYTVSAAAIQALSGAITLQAGGDLSINAPLALVNQTVGNNVTFQAGGNININSSVSTTGGTLTFIAKDPGGTVVAAAKLNVNAPVGSATTGGITFTDNGTGQIQLGNTVSSAGNITFSTATTLTADVKLTGANVTFSSTLNSDATANNRKLTIDGSGTSTFSGIVGGTTAIGSINVLAGGATHLGGANITTTGDQTYGSPVSLTGAETLAASGSGTIAFGSTLDGTQALTVNTAGRTVFGGTVGGTTPLTSITTDLPGTTAIKANITTTGAAGFLDFKDPLTLGATVKLTGSGNAIVAINLENTVNADLAANNWGLTLATSGSGTKTISGIVGGSQKLGSLTTQGSGLSLIKANVSAKTQDYKDPIQLGGSATFAGNTITFESTLDGDTAASRSLTVNPLGTLSFLGQVGNSHTLLALTTGSTGTTTLSGGVIKATTTSFGNPVTLTADTTVTGSAIGFSGTVDADVLDTRQLTLTGSGLTTFGGAVGSAISLKTVATDAAGTSTITGGAVTATTQTYADALTLGGASATTTLTGTTLTLAGVTGGGKNLTANIGGVTTFGGALTGVAALTTFGSGTTTINTTTITTTGAQDYKGAVTLSASATLAAGTGAVTFEKTLNGSATTQTLAINTTGTTTFSAVVGATHNLASLTVGITGTAGPIALNGGTVNAAIQSYVGNVTLGANTTLEKDTTPTAATSVSFTGTVNADAAAQNRTLLVKASGATTFTGAVGGTAALGSLTTDTGGTTQINSVTATTQTYNDAVTLGGAGAALTLSGTTINFVTTLAGGGKSLTTTATGTQTYGGAVSGLLNFTANGAAGAVVINGATVSGSGTQTYTDAVTLGADTVITSTGTAAAGNVTFSSTVNGAHALTVNSGGTTTFAGAVGGTTPLTAITTDAVGTTALNGGTIATTLAQTYNDAVTLGAAATLTTTGSSTTGNIKFGGTVNGAQTLQVNATGLTTFAGIVGGGTPLTSITTDSAGTTQLNANVTTPVLDFKDAVKIGGGTTATPIVISAGTSMNFEQTVDGDVAGSRAVTLAGAGTETIGGIVGGTFSLAKFTMGAAGLALNGGAVTATAQDYSAGTLTLGTHTTLSGTTLTLGVVAGGGYNLTTAGVTITTFGGNVSGVQNLTSTGPVTIAAAGPTITTAGNQSYGGAVTLAGNATLVSSAGGDITLASTVDGAHILEIDTTGTTTLAAAIGGTTALTSLLTDATGTVGGTLNLNGGTVKAATQTYHQDVRLGANTTLSSGTTATVTFSSRVDADSVLNNRTLTINSGAVATTFNGKVGSQEPLSSLVTDAAGTLTINAGSVVASTVTLGDAVTLGSDTTIKGSTISLAAITGAGFNLILSGTGTTTLNGAITGVAALTVGNGGATTIKANVTTTGKQTWTDAITLGAASVTLNAGAGNITLPAVTGAGDSLTITTSGAGVLNGAVTGVNNFTETAGESSFTVNGGAITASGGATYGDTVVLGANTTLTGGAGSAFAATEVTGNNYNLTLSYAGSSTVDSGFTGIRNLSSTAQGGGTLRLSGAVTTTQKQTYGAATLLADTTLTGSDVTINGAVTGGGFSLTLAAGTATFGGAVSGINVFTSASSGSTTINSGISATTIAMNNAMLLSANSTLVGATTLAAVAGQGKSLTVTGAATLNGDITGLSALSISGATVAKGKLVTTSGAQTYSGAYTVQPTTGTSITLTSSGSGAITFGSTIDDHTANTDSLIISSAGTTTITGVVGGGTKLNTLTIGSGAGGTGSLGGTVLTANVSTSGGSQSYNNAVTLAGDVVLNATAGAITLNAVTGGGHALTLTTTGAGTLAGAVAGLTTLTETAGESTFTVSGGSVSSSGVQTYNDTITLGADTTFTTTGAAAVVVKATAQFAGAFGVTLNSGGAGNLGTAAINNLTFLDTSPGAGAITLNAGVSTSGLQKYGPLVLATGAIPLASTGNATITFSSTVDGAEALTTTTTALTTFNGVVGGGTGLTSITTTAGGTGGPALIKASQTATTFTYNHAVTLGGGGAITLTGAGTLAGTVDATTAGSESLTVTGAFTLGGAVGGTKALASLSMGGTTALNGGAVTTTGTQTYTGLVTLGADATLTGTVPTFTAHLNGGTHNLNLSFSGATTLATGDLVVSTVNDLTVSKAINISGVVHTAGKQAYNGAVTLTGAATVQSDGAGAAGNITFNSTVDGGQTFTVNTAGTTTFAAAVGGGTALTSFTDTAGGPEQINGGTFKTTGNQTFNNAVNLGADATLDASTGTGVIDLKGVVSGNGFNFTINNASGHAAKIEANISGVNTFTVNNDLDFHTAATVTSIGNQTYSGPVIVTANSAIVTTGGGNVNFASTLNGVAGTETFAISTDGTTTFSGLVGGTKELGSLTTQGNSVSSAGTTAIKTSAIGADAQTYNNAVVLGADVAFQGADATHSATGNITFAGTVDSDAISTPRAVTAAAAGTLAFQGVVGGNFPLNTLADTQSGGTAGGGTTALGTTLTTLGTQTYKDAVSLTAATTLNGVAPATMFSGTVTGNKNLTLNLTGTILIDTAKFTAGGVANLTIGSGGVSKITTGTLSTTGSQTFNNPVQLVTDMGFTSTGNSPITFNSTIDNFSAAHFALTTTTTGLTTFGGRVGNGTNPLLKSVTVASGPTFISGGLVATGAAGVQDYSAGTLTLGNNTTLSSTESAANGINLGAVLGAGNNLTLDASAGWSTLNGNITGVNNLTTTGGAGTKTIFGAAITVLTTGVQTYNAVVDYGGFANTLTGLYVIESAGTTGTGSATITQTGP